MAGWKSTMEGVVNMSYLRDFYRGKTIFVTGNTGFKGSWLSLWLADMGAIVHGYSLEAPTNPNLYSDANVRSMVQSQTIGDVRDLEKLIRALNSAKPEIVFHLAAQPLVRHSYLHPRETYETNVMGTVNVLEAVRQVSSVRVCEVITTDKCYENHEWVYPYRENDPMGGYDPYSSSKGCAELVVSAYRQSFFPTKNIAYPCVSLSSARAGNVIGGGDWAEDRIIPDCIRYLQKNESILVRNPHAIRPWQHVLEPLSGYLSLACRQWQDPALFADAYNFGPLASDTLNVQQIAEQVIATWGSGQWHSNATGIQHTAEKFHEAMFLKLDITKAVTLLHWHPVYSVGEAITETVAWYRKRYENGPLMQQFTLDQIHHYEGCIARPQLSPEVRSH